MLNSEGHAIVFAKHRQPAQACDSENSSIAIVIAGNLDKDRFDQWIGHLLQAQGVEIFRMEGALNFDGKTYGCVLQAGHMLLDDHSGCLRESERHGNRLFFFGHNLDGDQLYKELKSCQIRRDGVFCRTVSLLFAAGDRIGLWFRMYFLHREPAGSRGRRRKCREVPSG